MNEVLTKLKEAAEIKANIAKLESLVWSKISEALNLYTQIQKTPEQKRTQSKETQANVYLDTKGAAKYLGLGVGTIHGWRFYGTGPKYVRMGRSIRYRVEDLEDFAAKNSPVSISTHKNKR